MLNILILKSPNKGCYFNSASSSVYDELMVLYPVNIVMSEVVEHFQQEARLTDENEAGEIRHKLETLVNNILAEVEKRDKRFQGTVIQSGSVYEGVKVQKPEEFDFMIRINCLTNKPLLHPCDKGDGYVKLALNDDRWVEFKDEQGFLSPNLLSGHFKKLVSESLNDTEVPEGLVIRKTNQQLLDSTWGPVYFTLLGNSSGQDNPSGLMYSETHGPATTLYLRWQGGDSYKNLEVTVDLTLSLEYPISQLPVQLAKLPQSVDEYLHQTGFHVVPAGFDSWRISFSVAEREILCTSPDGLKVCFRVLKVVRNTVSELLGLDSSLVPSYIFKTVLLSQLFIADNRWDKDCWSQLIDNVIEVILQEIVREEISSFFIPGYNLLSMTDHENKLRQCILREMQNELRGLKMKLTPEDVKETRQQIRVLEMIDLLEYVVSSSLHGKDPTTVWNKMFVNIDNIPQSHKYGHLWNQVTDLNTKELDENVYNLLIRIWSLVEIFFKRLLSSLQGELNLLAQKFYMRTCEKKKEYELKHKVTPGQCDVTQIPLNQLVYEIAHDLAECYADDEGYAFWSNLHKGVPPDNRSSRFFQDVAEVTVNSGSDQGLAMFKQRMKVYLAFVPEADLMTLVVNYVSQLFSFARDILKIKLDYITIPELDLD